MALDFLTKTSGETAKLKSEKQEPLRTDPNDPEGQTNAPHRMNRIDGKELPDLALSDTDSSLSVGAQIEKEKENAIQYRTCSWQKVWMFPI